MSLSNRIRRRLGTCLALLAALLAWSGAAQCADWTPVRPVRLINVFPAGGSTDSVARLLAQKLSDALGQQVIVDNRAGAGGLVGVEIAARAAPDGYTLVLLSNAVTIYRLLNAKMSFDPQKELAPVSLAAAAPLVLAVPQSLPVSSGAELVGYIRARPGKINYSSSGNATSSHLAGELFRSLANLDMVHVPYKGATPAINDLIAGQVQLMFSSALQMVPLVQGGKLKGLGVSSAKRLPVMPEMPAIGEFVAGYELSPWFGVMAPTATPRRIVDRFATEIAKALQRPEVQDFYQRQGSLAVYNSPAEFARFIAAEAPKWQGLVKRIGVRAD